MDTETRKRFSQIEKSIGDLKDNHLASIAKRLTTLEDDMGWVKKLSMLILAAVIAGAVATILSG